MYEPSALQKLAAEAIGTAFLVFIGVGSVPATLIVNGDAPFTMADLGMISLAFGTIVVATVYALGHIGGNHINPAVTLGLAATGKFPWSQVPSYIAAQCLGAVIGAAAIIGVLGQKASDVGLGVASYADTGRSRPGLHRRVRRHVHLGVHDLRRDPPQGAGWIRRARHRSGGLRGHHSGRPGHRRLDQPGPHLRPDARPADRRRHGEVGATAGLPRSRSSLAGVLAGLAYVALTKWLRRRRGRRPGQRPTSHHVADSPTRHRILEQHMKKLINDPADVVSEALLGIEAAHPDLRVDHENKIIYRGDAPRAGQGRAHLRRRFRPRAAARRIRRSRHARRRLRR